ncbi:MAG: hypothetical protein WC867_07175 [Candidatus Pacearchaeota archaeon]|jgi:hypothetical protein
MLEIIYLINSIVTLIIFFILLKGYFIDKAKKHIQRVVNVLFGISLIYFILFLYSSLWYFEILEYSLEDFLLINTLMNVIQTLLLFRIVYLLNQNKNLFYLLFFYVIGLLSVFSSIINFYNIFLIISYLLTLALLLVLGASIGIVKKSSNYGIAYSCISLILLLFSMYFPNLIFLFSIFSNILFLLFIYNFIKILDKCPVVYHDSRYKKKHYIFIFLRYLTFVITITNLVFIGTLAVHEFGHFSVAKLYGCEYSKIIYESDMPYTETFCKMDSKNNLLFGGIFLPFLIGFILFIVGGLVIRDISLLIIGFNLIVSTKDFIELGLTENIILISIIAGVLFLITGIVMLAKSRTEDYMHIVFDL